ncbi:MAG: hypothetical protein GVY04_20885 [Cyanobacteria bacterium]|jgi:hypothetical protein|nr:hypothetical protein [Cyanobacteria bacterium GSL.Bin1]
MTNRTEQILGLSPRQALAIMQYMTAYLAERRVDDQNFDPNQQIEVLNAAFKEADYPPLLTPTVEASEQEAGQAAQQFLILLAESGDDKLLAELDGWLTDPPEAAIAAIPLVLAVPIVLTGCIVALQTRVVIERTESGTWSIYIEKRSLEGKALAEIVGGLFNVIKVLPGK